MTLYQLIKTGTAVSYFAHAFMECRGELPTQMWIYKLLSLLDFRVLKLTGEPCLGLAYDAFENGPVPREIYDARKFLKTDWEHFFKIQKSETKHKTACYYIGPVAEPNLEYLSDVDIDVIEQLCDEFLLPKKSLKELIEATHREIRSWQVAWDIAQKNGRKSLPMEYEDEFPGLSEKSEDTLTLAEDAFLMYCGFRSLEETLCES